MKRFVLVVLLGLASSGRWSVVGGQEITAHAAESAAPAAVRRFAVPVEVAGLPPGARQTPVACPVDFAEILRALKVAGAVDEFSLRLAGPAGDGGPGEVAVQFSPAASGAAGPIRGSLAWLAAADAQGRGHYRLEFAVPTAGRMLRVPYPPADLRAFDAEDRARPLGRFPRMQIHPQWPLEGMIHVSENHAPVTSYHIGPPAPQPPAPYTLRRPFFYPVRGPDGFELTEFGKTHDPTGSHAHHYSLWIAHASVGGHDFWSERGGSIVHQGFELLEDGPVFCRFIQKTRWVYENVELLAERRSVTCYAAGPESRLIDFQLEFSPPGRAAVELGKTTFGFVGVRVASSMSPFDGGGLIVNSHGDCNEQHVHLKHADWLDQAGPVAAAPPAGLLWGGIAIFDHSDNPRHPTLWHCRNDGWACASFNGEGPARLEPGTTLRLSYRLCLHRGDAAAGQVAQRYAEYAARPRITLGAAAEVR